MAKLKLTENGNAVLEKGKVVIIGDDGKEQPLDALGAFDSVEKYRGEAGHWRHQLRAAEDKLDEFKGIDDPKAAREALETVGKIGDDHKVELDGLRAELSTSFQNKIDTQDGELKNLTGQLFKMQVTDKFRTSDVAKELIYTPQDAAKIFESNFTVVEGKIQGALDGKVIYSKENPGEVAGFDESLKTMIESRTDKDSILKPTGVRGSGVLPGRQDGTGGGSENTALQNISEGLQEAGLT